MTREIFRQDAYLFNFESEVTDADGDNVVLESTAFYPGGGGQVCDTGALNGMLVKETLRKGNDIVHVVPGHGFKKGDIVWGSVDWERRYDLMKGHTAEHLLFGSLKRCVPDVNIVKIFISPESKYVVIDRDVTWDSVNDSVNAANDAVFKNLTVRRVMMDRGDPEMSDVRIDLDKIKDGSVSVIDIGDVDSAACSGIHIMETEEIGMIFADRKVSAGKDGFALHFKIGQDAMRSAAGLGNTCLMVSDILDSKPDDIVKAAANMKEQLEAAKKNTREITLRYLRSLEPETIGGVDVFSSPFPPADGRTLADASGSFAKNGAVSVIISADEQATVYIASGSDKVDAASVLSDIVKKFGGRGGGKKGFAQGASPDASKADEMTAFALNKIRERLS